MSGNKKDSILKKIKYFSIFITAILLVYILYQIIIFNRSNKRYKKSKKLYEINKKINRLHKNYIKIKADMYQYHSGKDILSTEYVNLRKAKIKEKILNRLSENEKRLNNLLKQSIHTEHEKYIKIILELNNKMKSRFKIISDRNINNFLLNTDEDLFVIDKIINKIYKDHQKINEKFFHNLKFKLNENLYLLIIFSCIILISIVLVIKFRSVATRRLKTILNELKKEKNQKMGTKLNYPYNDEWSEVIDEFNKLIVKNKKTKKQINKTKKYLNNIINSSPMMIIGVDRKGLVKIWNKEVEKFTGIKRKSAYNEYFWELHDLLEKYRLSYKYAVLRKENLKLKEERYQYKSKKYLFNINIYLLEENEISGAVLIIEDITEEKHKQKRIRKSQKLETIGTLTSGIAHDFNNILFAIMGYNSILKNKLENKEQKEIIDKSITASNRAKELIRQILQFSRNQESQKKVISIKPVIKEVFKLFKSTGSSNIELKKTINSNVGYIYADPVQIHQLLMNLCTNAVQSMENSGGVLKIKLEEVFSEDIQYCTIGNINYNKYIKISVSDTGKGISREEIDKIFKSYYTTKDEGTGLGLSIVKDIINEVDGVLKVESKINEKTVVEVYLPKYEEKNKIQTKQNYKQKHRKNVKSNIMVIDDENAILDVIKKKLEMNDLNVKTFSDIENAYKYLTNNVDNFDLILSDFKMPKMNAKEFLHKIRDDNIDIPVILLTGYADKVDKSNAIKLGFYDIMYKPISFEKLLDNIYNVLEK